MQAPASWTKQWPTVTDAEQCSTAKWGTSKTARTRSYRRLVTLPALAIVTAITSTVVAPLRPAGADQIADAKAEAAALSAKLTQEQQQVQSLTDQVNAAQYKVAQLDQQIAAGQQQIAADQVQVSKNEAKLRTQAISDYTHSGSSPQLEGMFSTTNNTAGIRNTYAAIATGNVTNTVDSLHTAQANLRTEEAVLQQQQTEAAATQATVQSEENQAAALVSQEQSALNGVNAHIAQLVKQQQEEAAAEAAAAARAAYQQQLAASQAAQRAAAAQAASRNVTVSSSSGGSSGAAAAPSYSTAAIPGVSSAASVAIQAAQSQRGVPYVWGGATPGVGFDCSGLVMWAYAQAGVSLPHYSGGQYDATVHIPLAAMAPGDLLFYGPGGDEHVAMYIGGGMMVEAPQTGQTVHDTPVRTGGGFVGVGRVQ